MNLWGCHSKPRDPGYLVKDGFFVAVVNCLTVAHQRVRWHENTMSNDCRYDLKETDERCRGCLK